MALPDAPPLDPELIQRVSPVNLSGERTRPVPEALSELFPSGGLNPGWSISVSGEAAWSLAMLVWAKALGSEGWVAVVGVPDFGLGAASEHGVKLDRVVVVETPPAGKWAAVVASLLEAFDIVAVDPVGQVGIRDARRLSARARERGSVLFHLDGGNSWPTPVDLTLVGANGHWEGIGNGHGHLRSRRLSVRATGRRTGSPRSTAMELP